MQTDSTNTKSPLQRRIEELKYCHDLIEELLGNALDLPEVLKSDVAAELNGAIRELTSDLDAVMFAKAKELFLLGRYGRPKKNGQRDLEIYDQCRIHGQPYPAIAARYGITSARVFAICSDVDSFIFKVRQDRFTQERTQAKVHAAVAD